MDERSSASSRLTPVRRRHEPGCSRHRTAARALVIQHEEPTPPGLILDWLAERGADVDVLRIDVRRPHDVDPRDYGLIVSLGSEFAAYRRPRPWIGREIDFPQDATEADVPILGVCFGGQLLARVLGGEVFRSERAGDRLAAGPEPGPELVPDGPWFQWHFDSFTAPPGATVLARNEVGPQAYVIGRSLGVQFHPEVTPEIMEPGSRRTATSSTSTASTRTRSSRRRTRRASRRGQTSLQLLDGFLERIARIEERA